MVDETSVLLPNGGSQADVAGRWIWLAQREAERRSLEGGDVPAALVTAAEDVAPPFRRLSPLRPWPRLFASGWHVFGNGAYVATAGLARFSPAAAAVQVIAGQVLAGSTLFAGWASTPAAIVVVVGVLAIAELLAVVGRLDTWFERNPGDDHS